MVWWQRNASIEVPMTNERERQTYYGAVNLLTHQFHLQAFPAGKGECTVAYVRWVRGLYPDKQIILRVVNEKERIKTGIDEMDRGTGQVIGRYVGQVKQQVAAYQGAGDQAVFIKLS